MKTQTIGLWFAIIAMILCLSISNDINAQDQLPGEAGIAFGFRDSTGTKILIDAGDSVTDPQKFTFAFADDGIKNEIEYVGYQKHNKKDNGRRTPGNFYNCAGFVYKLTAGKVSGDGTIVLTTAKFIEEHKPLSWIVPERETLPTGSKETMNNQDHKIVRDYRGIGNLENGKIFIIEFMPVRDTLFAACAWFGQGNSIFRFYPAARNATSTWRVDDAGRFGLDYYTVLAVFEYKGKIEIVTDWIGTEGYATEFIRQDGDSFITIETGYRYSAPL